MKSSKRIHKVARSRLARSKYRPQALRKRPARKMKPRAELIPPSPPPAAVWNGCAHTMVGLSHIRQIPPQPCQDAAVAVPGNRPILIVADGAGSAALSHIGAQTVVTGLKRFIQTLSEDYASILDPVSVPTEDAVRKMALRPVRHAIGLISDLSVELHHEISMFRSTLIIAIGGRSRWLWLRVGDGALVAEMHGKLGILGQSGKGEFANQTRFIDQHLQPEDVQFGYVDGNGLSGIAAMTDGAAERLVQESTGVVAPRLAQWIQKARTDQFNHTDLHYFFTDAAVWQGTSGDDRGLAILART